jgi:hypothetical protein
MIGLRQIESGSRGRRSIGRSRNDRVTIEGHDVHQAVIWRKNNIKNEIEEALQRSTNRRDAELRRSEHAGYRASKSVLAERYPAKSISDRDWATEGNKGNIVMCPTPYKGKDMKCACE